MLSQDKPMVSLSKAFKRNSPKFESLDISNRDNINPIPNIIINLTNEREDIFYDPLKYKTQKKAHKSKDESSSDLKSTNKSQSTVLIDPKVTFFEKFAEKRWQRQVTKILLEQGLLLSDAVNPNTFTLKYDSLSNINLENIWNELYKDDMSTESEKLLPLQTTQTIHPILNNFQIPAEFINLLESEIFD
ncbi:34561_t:CDS:2 [Gigaspora margarita]|uniref:34561_t:CDS:1 n=1 Tax=Gigaspora margarita TaxID=4874 RepID=A0ABM8VZ61_GIGMA|nr:34561_t:CDS:2 [Gigaspora margarita]